MADNELSQEERDARRRRRTLKMTLAELTAELANEDGLRRLREITDEEWQAAVDRDGGE